MPQIAAIVINDGASTPVAHTFSPIGRDNNGVFWFEQTTPAVSSPIGAKRIGYKQTRVLDSRKRETGVSRCTYTLSVPSLETLATNDAGFLPPATLAYEEVCRISFDLADRSITQERKDTRVLVANFLAHAMAVANVDTLQPSYS